MGQHSLEGLIYDIVLGHDIAPFILDLSKDDALIPLLEKGNI